MNETFNERISRNTILEKKPFRKEYEVMQTIYENGEDKTRLSFVAEVERFDAFRYSINRKNMLINGQSPDFLVEEISVKTGNMFFPLKLETLENGNLKQITNQDEIRTRWHFIKNEFLQYYSGKGAQEIIKTIENELASKNRIQNRILNSFFYRLYFLPFKDYIKEKDTDFDLYLPVFPFKNKVKFGVTMKEFKLSENGKWMMQISGECTDSRSFIQMINNRKTTASDEQKCSGKAELVYQFNKEDGSVLSINADVVLISDDEKNERQIIFELNPANTK